MREASSLLSWRKIYITSTSVFLPQELAVSMEGDKVLHNELHSSARSLDPDNEVSGYYNDSKTIYKVLRRIYCFYLSLVFRGAKVWGRSQYLGAIHWGPFIFHWGTSIVILIGGILIIAPAVTLVLPFLNPLLYRNTPLLTVSILERVAGRG